MNEETKKNSAELEALNNDPNSPENLSRFEILRDIFDRCYAQDSLGVSEAVFNFVASKGMRGNPESYKYKLYNLISKSGGHDESVAKFDFYGDKSIAAFIEQLEAKYLKSKEAEKNAA